MDARKALIHFHNYMLSLHGQDYRSEWSADDKLTADILERRARKAVTVQLIRARDDTPFLHRFKGRNPAVTVTHQERREEWGAYERKYGHGITTTTGKLFKPKRRVYSEIGLDFPEPVEEDAYKGPIKIAGSTTSVTYDPEPANRDSAAWFLWNARQ